LVQWITSLVKLEVAHLALYATRIALAATGNRAAIGDFTHHTIQPGLVLLRGDGAGGWQPTTQYTCTG